MALGFKRDGAIKNGSGVFKRRFVNVTDLVCIHEAGIAHHVAAVGKVHGQNCATTKLDVRRSMMMDVLVFSSAEVASEEERFDPLEERRVSRHHVNKLAVLRTGLAHDHLSVLFDYLSFDFAWMLIHQRLERRLAADDGVANFLDATRTKTVSLTWESERRRGSLIGFQQRSGGPFGTDSLSFR